MKHPTALHMLMHGPHGKLAHGGEVGSEPPGSHELPMEGHHYAMKAFIHAVHNHDHHGAHKALMDWHDMREDSMDEGDMKDPLENA